MIELEILNNIENCVNELDSFKIDYNLTTIPTSFCGVHTEIINTTSNTYFYENNQYAKINYETNFIVIGRFQVKKGADWEKQLLSKQYEYATKLRYAIETFTIVIDNSYEVTGDTVEMISDITFVVDDIQFQTLDNNTNCQFVLICKAIYQRDYETQN